MIAMMNRLTAALTYYGPWVLFLFWEICALILRAQGHRVGTISMVARDHGWAAVVVPFLWGGMASHWWWPSEHAGGAITSVLFWLIGVALFVWDLSSMQRGVESYSPVLLWLRFPFAWCVIGFICGGLLFPQTGIAPWRAGMK